MTANDSLNVSGRQISILQGRVLPDDKEVLQVFPSRWKEELALIKELGFDGVELLDDKEGRLRSVLREEKGELLKNLSPTFQAPSICMDLLCRYSFERDSKLFFEVMRELIELWDLPCTYVVPFFDDNTTDLQGVKECASILEEEVSFLKKKGANLSLEANIQSKELGTIELPLQVGWCFDLGNREEEESLKEGIELLFPKINHVHVKHKKEGVNSPLEDTVQLQEGAAALSGYNGNFALETCIKPNPVDEARRNLSLSRSLLSPHQKKVDSHP